MNNLSEKEFLYVSALSADKRVEYFVKRVVDNELVWALWLNGWCVYKEESGQEAIGVWPHVRYATECASGLFKGAIPKEILLSDWMDRWLPGMSRDGRGVVIFPTTSDKGCAVTPEYLKNLLESESEKY